MVPMGGGQVSEPNQRLWEFTLHEGEGRCALSLMIVDTGAGIQGLLTGGEKPHIGGSVLGIPRPSLTGEGWGVDLFVIPVPGHKDVEVARFLTERMARELKQTVMISAGIHSDNITGAELIEIQRSCEKLAEAALARLDRHNHWDS